jgi:PAS domain S-box-containing protein
VDNIYKAILEDTLAGFWHWDINTQTIHLSCAYKALLGYDVDEVPNTFESWQKLVHPEDLPLILQSMERHVKSKGGIAHNIEARFMHKDGPVVWVMCSGRVVEWDGDTPLRMAGCHIDIDKQKKAQQELQISEERFRGAFEHSAIGMALVSPEGKWLKVNRKLCQIIGYTSDELFSLTFQDITHPEDLENDLLLLQQLLAKEIESYQLEKRYFHKNGNTIWTLLGVSLVRDEFGAPLHFVSQIEDITQRKHAEADLIKSEAKYRTIFENVQDVFYKTNIDGVITEISPSVERFTGIKREEAIGRHVEEFYYNVGDREKLLTELQKNGGLIDYYLQLKTIDGQIIHTSANISFILDDKGNIAGIEGSMRDNSARKKAEIALKESQDKYSKLYRSVQDIFFRLDAEGYIVEISPAIEKYEGFKQEEFIGKHASIFYYVPAEREPVLAALMANGKIDDYNIRLVTPDGGFVYASINAYVIHDDDGNFIGSEGSIRDITTRVLAEEALKERDALLTKFSQQIPGVIYQFQINPDGHSFFPFASKELIDLYGLTPDQIRDDSEPVFERVHIDDREAFHNSIAESYQTLNKWEHEFRVNLLGKDIKWLRGVSRPEKNPDGSVLWHGYVADVTEQKLKEQQLQHTFDLITEQNNRLINFAYIISHNLRTHSGNFEMLVKLILDSNDEDEKNDFIQHLKKVSEMLSETIMHLNEVVSIQTSIDNQLTRINLFEYVEKAIAVLTVNTDTEQIVINNMVHPGLEIDYNPAYMESIIFNLLSNAIKYRRPERQNIITITSHDGAMHPVLEFTDNGLGIDMQRNGDKLFGMYRTFHHNANAKGIGLFLTKTQIEAMGGKIEVTSEVDKGSTFKVTFTR